MSGNDAEYRPSTATAAVFLTMTVAGGVALVAGFLLEPAQRTWVNLLVASNFLIGLGLGGLLLVALHYVTGARWDLPLRRVPEAMTAALPVAAVGIAAVLICCPSLYSSASSTETPESPLHHLWHNRAFFLVRSLVYFALWIGFALTIVRNSRRQDTQHDNAPTNKNRRLSAGFLVIFGMTCWLASTDWLMSLERNWSSTIFSVYNFAGIFLSALAAMILLVLWLRRFSSLQTVVKTNHLHDLGTLLFSMSSFWMYIWFCQYMLIWYVNNPEETSYLRVRWQGTWPTWMFVDLALNWAIPFVVLLFRYSKRNPLILGCMAVLVLVGRWVDLSLMILPTQSGSPQQPGLLEAGLLIGAVGVFGLVVFWNLRRAPLVPLLLGTRS
jgi:hypothetical protein